MIVKQPAQNLEREAFLARFLNEREIYDRLAGDHRPRLLEFDDGPEGVALVFEDLGWRSLREHADDQGLTLAEALHVTLRLLDALTMLHGHGVIHRDLKPDNVLVDGTLSQVSIIDFGIATTVVSNGARAGSRGRLEGTPEFMAPELTGRVNRVVDYRSDYYCLGATMYWMLTGEPPFGDSGDRSELIHAHIARVPERLDRRDPSVPAPVAGIVAKLLAKSASDRYQGAFGLRRDLERCLQEIERGGEVVDFELASVDPSEQLRMPQRLYGREAQRDRLTTARARACLGPVLVLLSGPTGCGKTSLVRDLCGSLEEDSADYIEYVAELEPGEPLAAVEAILGGLLRRYAQGPADLRAAVRERLRDRLGDLAALLAELWPAHAEMLEVDAPLATVGPGELRARFWEAVSRLISALLLPERELVIFIDDLQWADETCLRLIERLLEPGAEGEARSLLVIASLRDEIGGEPSPIRGRLEAVGCEQVEIPVGPLGAAQVRQWAEALLGGSAQTDAFTRLLMERTRGIPLYLGQFIVALHDTGVLAIDRATGTWHVDLERARAQQSSGDVLDFLAERFHELPEQSRQLLGLAAHLGVHFDQAALAMVADEDAASVGWVLASALAAGFLLPAQHEREAGRYRFVHERVRRVAAQSLEGDSGALHLAIARRLGHADDWETVHAVAEHVARAVELITEGEERARFAQLCMRAAERARAAAVFDGAARDYATATRLLDDEEEHAVRFDALLGLAECAFMAGSLDQAVRAYVEARAQASSRLEQTRLLLSRAKLFMVPGDAEAALEVVLEAARLYELELRRGAPRIWAEAQLDQLLARLEAIEPSEISRGPLLDDPELEALFALLLAGTNPAYMSGDIGLMVGLVSIVLDLSLEHGQSDISATCFVQLAVFLANIDDYAGARRQAEIGFALFERFPASVLFDVASLIYAATVQPWVAPLGSSLDTLERAHAHLRSAGRYVDAGYAVTSRVYVGLALGVPLPEAVEYPVLALAFLRTMGSRSQCMIMEMVRDAQRALMDPRVSLPEPPPAAELSSTNFYFSRAALAFAAWFLGAEEHARSCIAEVAEARAAGAGAGSVFTEIEAAMSLIIVCRGYEALDPEARADLDVEVEDRLVHMRRWETSCAELARPLRLLVEGSWSRAVGQLERAFTCFDEAADAAAAAGLVHFEAMANEKAAKILRIQGRSKFAVGYLEQARRCYARWGARAVLERFDELLRAGDEVVRVESTTAHETEDEGLQTLDVASVVKLSQALAEASSTAAVIDNLLRGSIENAGADRGALVLEADGGPELVGLLEHGREGVRLPKARPLTGSDELVVVGLIRAARDSAEAVVVDDAPVDERCVRERRVVEHGPRSILALPIVVQGGPAGVLYLENRVLEGVFSTLDLEVLSTLARQAIIALENLRLFDVLRTSEARWRSLVDNAPDFIAIIDREHRFEFVNRVEFGLKPDSVFGAHVEAFVPPDVVDKTHRAIELVFETGGHGSYESVYRLPTGEQRHMTTRLGPIKRGDEIERVTMITTDRTDQVHLEEQLHQAQKMQAIGTLAGGVAHDFNNLLTVVFGASELASLEIGEDHPAASALAEIIEAAERAAELTRQLLAFSRKSVLKPQRVDLNELVNKIVKLLRRLIGEHVELALELADAKLEVDVDPGQMEQVVMNLAVNARDAMPDGGVLTLRTGSRQLGEAAAAELGLGVGAHVVLEIQDSGVGIPEHQMARIFEPFYTTKAPGEGTGLGLSTVLGIVEQSGGVVRVNSRPSEGACFSIILPVATVVREQSGPVRMPVDMTSGDATVLVVEDEPAVARLAARVLARQGYTVLRASDGEEARRVADRAETIDLLLIDVVMPGANGRVVADELLERHPRMRVLYMSGYTDDAIMRHGVLDGSRAFLHKPFTRVSLILAVQEALGRGGAERRSGGAWS
ncbi:AAA family ATPase [Pseudenhygromyxa sp. WMMC2535]|nr:AAA family ATPase [Pseudenhygromyxa sp. WMMC2535]